MQFKDVLLGGNDAPGRPVSIWQCRLPAKVARNGVSGLAGNGVQQIVIDFDANTLSYPGKLLELR
jgi:hypothetical protein